MYKANELYGHPMLGRKHSEETKYAISLAKQGKSNPLMQGALHPWYNPYKKTRKTKWVKVDDEWRREHVVIAEKILGRRLKENEVVHHINTDPLDNRHTNLIIMERAMHTILHQKMLRRDYAGSQN